MDRLDFDILARLYRAPRASYEEVGTVVGLSGNAVKTRLRRLLDEGVLQGFAATPDPAVLGMSEGILAFSAIEDLEEREDELSRSLPDVSGVRFVDVTVDRSVVLWLYFRDEADWERIERAAVSLVGKPPSHALRLRGGPARKAPSPADWKIAQALLADGRMSLKDLAARTRMSFKTVKRHLEALLGSGALRIEPVLSTSEASGVVLYDLLVVLREGASLADLATLLPETTIATGPATTVEGSRFVVLHGQSRTLRDAQRDARAVKASPHVERVILEIATRRRADAWLDEALALRIAQPLAPALASGPASAQLAPVVIPPRKQA